ncbi:hypothetical protein SARC_01865 [Sphaeroforma arctica JP610]|uniref:Uncharacterized protein n=1 Tax=Sphaeroforma arctica JP610 TaxID=667725 RepID=A0A0L0GAE3_9EUKA|nr:hypothetical protein SARC_01865 [Sphaeroforma arctica JP610]KNC85960.1 hypothetical protein SARC_01865 [Sphaeroforma arctica JP610]|eukprot:XP_014159862.1 hypothetical protein SARC_01865 [Sphaeroforma arctica JP610]
MSHDSSSDTAQGDAPATSSSMPESKRDDHGQSSPNCLSSPMMEVNPASPHQPIQISDTLARPSSNPSESLTDLSEHALDAEKSLATHHVGANGMGAPKAAVAAQNGSSLGIVGQRVEEPVHQLSSMVTNGLIASVSVHKQAHTSILTPMDIFTHTAGVTNSTTPEQTPESISEPVKATKNHAHSLHAHAHHALHKHKHSHSHAHGHKHPHTHAHKQSHTHENQTTRVHPHKHSDSIALSQTHIPTIPTQSQKTHCATASSLAKIAENSVCNTCTNHEQHMTVTTNHEQYMTVTTNHEQHMTVNTHGAMDQEPSHEQVDTPLGSTRSMDCNTSNGSSATQRHLIHNGSSATQRHMVHNGSSATQRHLTRENAETTAAMDLTMEDGSATHNASHARDDPENDDSCPPVEVHVATVGNSPTAQLRGPGCGSDHVGSKAQATCETRAPASTSGSQLLGHARPAEVLLSKPAAAKGAAPQAATVVNGAGQEAQRPQVISGELLKHAHPRRGEASEQAMRTNSTHTVNGSVEDWVQSMKESTLSGWVDCAPQAARVDTDGGRRQSNEQIHSGTETNGVRAQEMSKAHPTPPTPHTVQAAQTVQTPETPETAQKPQTTQTPAQRNGTTSLENRANGPPNAVPPYMGDSDPALSSSHQCNRTETTPSASHGHQVDHTVSAHTAAAHGQHTQVNTTDTAEAHDQHTQVKAERADTLIDNGHMQTNPATQMEYDPLPPPRCLSEPFIPDDTSACQPAQQNGDRDTHISTHIDAQASTHTDEQASTYADTHAREDVQNNANSQSMPQEDNITNTPNQSQKQPSDITATHTFKRAAPQTCAADAPARSRLKLAVTDDVATTSEDGSVADNSGRNRIPNDPMNGLDGESGAEIADRHKPELSPTSSSVATQPTGSSAAKQPTGDAVTVDDNLLEALQSNVTKNRMENGDDGAESVVDNSTGQPQQLQQSEPHQQSSHTAQERSQQQIQQPQQQPQQAHQQESSQQPQHLRNRTQQQIRRRQLHAQRRRPEGMDAHGNCEHTAPDRFSSEYSFRFVAERDTQSQATHSALVGQIVHSSAEGEDEIVGEMVGYKLPITEGTSSPRLHSDTYDIANDLHEMIVYCCERDGTPRPYRLDGYDFDSEYTDRDIVYIRSVEVKHTHRHRGVGVRMVRGLLEWLKGDWSIVLTEVAQKNDEEAPLSSTVRRKIVQQFLRIGFRQCKPRLGFLYLVPSHIPPADMCVELLLPRSAVPVQNMRFGFASQENLKTQGYVNEAIVGFIDNGPELRMEKCASDFDAFKSVFSELVGSESLLEIVSLGEQWLLTCEPRVIKKAVRRCSKTGVDHKAKFLHRAISRWCDDKVNLGQVCDNGSLKEMVLGGVINVILSNLTAMNRPFARHIKVPNRMDVNEKDIHGYTPLHAAAFANLPKESVEVLLACGADKTIENAQGFRAVDEIWQKNEDVRDNEFVMLQDTLPYNTVEEKDIMEKRQSNRNALLLLMLPDEQKVQLVDGILSPRMRFKLLKALDEALVENMDLTSDMPSVRTFAELALFKRDHYKLLPADMVEWEKIQYARIPDHMLDAYKRTLTGVDREKYEALPPIHVLDWNFDLLRHNLLGTLKRNILFEWNLNDR